MATINQLSQLNQLSGSDQLAVYSASNGDARKASLTTLLNWIESSFASPDFVTQYASPNVNGTNVAVSSTTNPTWLIITPTAAFATMTITLPAAASVADGTEVLIFCTQAVTTLTVAGNGAAAVLGAPQLLNANTAFALRYNGAASTWYATQSTVNATQATQGSFVPTPSIVAPVVNTTFSARYTTIANVVTLEFDVNVGAGGSITYDPATDFFTGLPVALEPASQQQQIVSMPQLGVPSDPFLTIGYAGGAWRLVLITGGGAFTINVAGSYRWTATYLV